MKATIKKISLFMLTLAVVFTMAASTGMNTEAASKKPTKITLKATSKTVDIKGKVKVSVKSVKPSKASKSVTYKSSNKKIATVSSSGTVTGKKKGTVKITATSKKNKKVKSTIKITVKDLKASSVKLNASSKTVAAGKTSTLKATVKGATGFYNQGVTWKSSNTKVATVTSKGVVKGIAAGRATITATEKGGSKKATCVVTVTEPVKVDKETGTVTLKGILNASATKTPTMHYLVTVGGGASGSNPMFTGLNDRIELANALDSLGATAWNTNSKTRLANGESIANTDKEGTNKNYSKLNISVSWAGHDEVSMQDTLKNQDGSAYTGSIIYANSGAVQKAIPSGCEICTSSCYAGICASEDVAMGKNTIGNAANLPKAGTVVTIKVSVDGYKAPYNYISKEDLKADIDGNQAYKILDVRQAERYATAHIAGAVSADVDGAVTGADVQAATDNIKAAIKGDDASTKYVLVCNSGKSYAQAATAIMIKEGISNKNIFTLTGGMSKDAGGWDYDNYCVKSYTSTGNFNFTNGMTVAQLKANLEAGNTPFVVFDLRDAANYAKAHIKGAISTPLTDYAKSDYSDDASKATLESAVKANPNKYYVVECFSGNKYANKAVNYLKEIGVKEERIIVLEGGAAAWTYDTETSELPVDIDAATKTINLYGYVNGDALNENTMHFLVSRGHGASSHALILGLNDRIDFAKALDSLSAKAWNSDSNTTLNDGQSIADTDNKDYTHFDVNVSWGGKTVAMKDLLQKTDGSALNMDMVYANNSAIQEAIPSGCELCSTSCYAGIGANAAEPFYGAAKVKANADAFPAAGTIVKVSITLK